MLIGIARFRIINLDEDKKRPRFDPALRAAGHLCLKCSSNILR